MALYVNDFSQVFSNLLKELGVSNYQISQFSHIDEGYLSNLKNGHKSNPSPEVLVRISLALAHFSKKAKLNHIEQLFNATGRSLITNRRQSSYI